MSFTPAEIERMSPAVREEIQGWLLRAHNARTRRATHGQPIPEPDPPVVEKRWSNGACVYCGKDDGFTEIRKVGPVHLEKCHARANHLIQKPVRVAARRAASKPMATAGVADG